VDVEAAARGLPVGALVVAENGEELGRVHTVHPHYFLVEQGTGLSTSDLEVPIRAVAAIDGARVVLRVNREALSEVPDEHQSAAHRLHEEG
jgi:hypothetical protein